MNYINCGRWINFLFLGFFPWFVLSPQPLRLQGLFAGFLEDLHPSIFHDSARISFLKYVTVRLHRQALLRAVYTLMINLVNDLLDVLECGTSFIFLICLEAIHH